MLMGLMVMAFGTAGIAAWVSLLSARSEQVNNYELQLHNRIAKLNSEAIVKQAIYSKCLNSNRRTFKFYRVPETKNSVIVRGTNDSAFRPFEDIRLNPPVCDFSGKSCLNPSIEITKTILSSGKTEIENTSKATRMDFKLILWRWWY